MFSNSNRKRSNQQIHDAAVGLVVQRLRERGVDMPTYSSPEGNSFRIALPGWIDIQTEHIGVYVKSRLNGNWQVGERFSGDWPGTDKRVWVFVDFVPSTASFFVVPDVVITGHLNQKWKEAKRKKPRREGFRLTVDDDVVSSWRDRWDLIPVG